MTTSCKLCSQYPALQPVYLSCKHTFCFQCLQAYVYRGQYMDCLNFPCPHCTRLSAPPWGIWHLSHKVVDRSHDEVYQTWKYEAMCDSCASQALYATAGRRCTSCNVNLCDTCSYTHSVGLDTRTHPIITLISKVGTAAPGTVVGSHRSDNQKADGNRSLASSDSGVSTSYPPAAAD